MNNSPALKRRTFLQASSAALLAAGTGPFTRAHNQPGPDRPNIVWITAEDLSPHFGCYGDTFAHTPNVDRLAREGVRYENAFAPAPLCTPARSTLITGVYASTMGTQHLRGVVPLADSIQCYSTLLRRAGYYCTNNEKEDYNFPTPDEAWDDSSGTAHWRNRPEGKPFFSVFNFMTTHQSQTRYGEDELKAVSQQLAPEERVNPDEVPIPPYYPDTPTVRTNLAAFYTQITLMDKQVQEILNQLDADGLAEDTIVFFYSDHGDGLPRGKRWLHDTGIRVPLIIRFPEKYQHLAPGKPGTVVNDLVNFIDFPPTLLSLIGIEPPDYMQGRAFLGRHKQPPRRNDYAIRDRVDEVLMCSRSVHNGEYQYIRNFLPHRPRMQKSFFSERTPIRQELRRLHQAGELEGHETWLMQDRIPVDELYHLKTDPFQLHNLVHDPAFEDILQEMRRDLFEWMVETKDLGLIPEYEMLRQANGDSPYDAWHHRFEPQPLLNLADKVGRGEQHVDGFKQALTHNDPSYRYWAATGLAALGERSEPARQELLAALQDDSPPVRFAAAEALCHLEEQDRAVPVLAQGLLNDDVVIALNASQHLLVIGNKAQPAVPEIKQTLQRLTDQPPRAWYTRENLKYMLQRFGEMVGDEG